MPIYEYECLQCGLEFEAIQGFSDKPLRKCESCGGKVRKLVSQSAFHLKGSGWYVTDYASKKPGSKPIPQKDADASGSADSASGSADSASASKKDTPTTAPASKKSDSTKADSKS